MKHIMAVAVFATASTLCVAKPTEATAAASTSTCDTADPTSTFATVGGDFELTVDPQDSASNLIIVANIANGNSSVVAARVNGLSGQIAPQTLTTIADNFVGDVHGPEIVQKPSGELGVIYAGPQGVHGVFRSQLPSAWDQLIYDVYGAQTSSSPPPLASTSVGAYPAIMPLGQNTYGQWQGDCQGICYGALGFGIPTDVVALLAPQGYTASFATQSTRDGYIFISACDASNACGIYEALIDNAGGFAADSFQKLVDLPAAPLHLAADRHPVTGTTILFSNNGTDNVTVWQQPATGGALTQIANVSAPKNQHYRVVSDPAKLVLNYFGATILTDGSYTIPVTAKGTKLVVGASKKIGKKGHGSELAYLPAVNKWAHYYRASGVLQRCWVAP